jgi:hypothetical protein
MFSLGQAVFGWLWRYQLVLVWLERRKDLHQIVWQPLLQHRPIFPVSYHHNTIVRVQVYAAIFHVGLLQVKVHLAN